LEKNDEQLKQHIKSMALTEMENDELKNDVRQMGYMVEDLEQKLDS
jgi:vacuolar-type H+-ATPase subunit E/Vma4